MGDNPVVARTHTDDGRALCADVQIDHTCGADCRCFGASGDVCRPTCDPGFRLFGNLTCTVTDTSYFGNEIASEFQGQAKCLRICSPLYLKVRNSPALHILHV